MTEIFIDPTKQNIAVQVTSQSLHAVGFEITVFAADGNTITENFTGTTQAINPFIQILANPPAAYKGSFISSTITVISPDGTDFPYAVLLSIKQNNAVVMPETSLSGTTTNGNDTVIAVYHIN